MVEQESQKRFIIWEILFVQQKYLMPTFNSCYCLHNIVNSIPVDTKTGFKRVFQRFLL